MCSSCSTAHGWHLACNCWWVILNVQQLVYCWWVILNVQQLVYCWWVILNVQLLLYCWWAICNVQQLVYCLQWLTEGQLSVCHHVDETCEGFQDTSEWTLTKRRGKEEYPDKKWQQAQELISHIMERGWGRDQNTQRKKPTASLKTDLTHRWNWLFFTRIKPSPSNTSDKSIWSECAGSNWRSAADDNEKLAVVFHGHHMFSVQEKGKQRE